MYSSQVKVYRCTGAQSTVKCVKCTGLQCTYEPKFTGYGTSGIVQAYNVKKNVYRFRYGCTSEQYTYVSQCKDTGPSGSVQVYSFDPVYIFDPVYRGPWTRSSSG